MKIRYIYFLVLALILCAMNFTFAEEQKEQPASYYDYIANKYAERQDFGTAIIYFKKAILQDPNYLPAYINLGVTYGKIGEYDLGIEALMRVRKLNPDLQSTYVNLSAIYEKKKDYDKAIDAAKQALSLNRNNAMAIYLLGSSSIMQGKTEQAMEEYRKLSRMNEDMLAVRLLNKIIQKAAKE